MGDVTAGAEGVLQNKEEDRIQELAARPYQVYKNICHNSSELPAKFKLNYGILGRDLAIARYQPRPCGQHGGFAPTFFQKYCCQKCFFLKYFL